MHRASVLRFVLEKGKPFQAKSWHLVIQSLDKDRNLPHAEEEVERIKESYPIVYIHE